MKNIILITAFTAALSYAQPALYPTSVATTDDLLCSVNNATTTLNGSITSFATTVILTSGSIFSTCPSGFVFTVDSEIIHCQTRLSNTFGLCSRGFDGSTAASHTNLAPVRGLNYAKHHNQTAAEVIAIQAVLGPGFGGSNGFWARTAAGVWSARSIVGTTNRIVITNGDGVGGNPTADIGSDVALKSDSSGIPTGMVAFFAVASCPTGWAEYTAMRGRYGVGLVSSGTLEGTTGTALTNTENRAVGQHSHSVTDPGHTHVYSQMVNTGSGFISNGSAIDGSPTSTSSATTGISIANSGSVAGTNAPYIQLLACKKN